MTPASPSSMPCMPVARMCRSSCLCSSQKPSGATGELRAFDCQIQRTCASKSLASRPCITAEALSRLWRACLADLAGHCNLSLKHDTCQLLALSRSGEAFIPHKHLPCHQVYMVFLARKLQEFSQPIRNERSVCRAEVLKRSPRSAFSYCQLHCCEQQTSHE